MINKKGFKLSSQGRIASAVSMALVLPMLSMAALADNIKPVGETSVSQVGQVDVVNIVNPNSKGLSHNQYKDFNVSEAGAVLNNSLQPGESQLVGQLDANGNLSESASVILNEVVSKNPSLLLGQQEVFGMAADYILANPNGISGKDIGFINTNRASLVVGKPTIEEERLAGFSVGDRNNKTLELSGEIDGDKRLDLLAPKVDVNGDITSSEAINVISGRNNIDYDSLQVSDHERSQPHVTLDGQLLGSMNSGRIRLHNTDSEATQILKGDFEAENDLKAVAANLNLIGSDVSAKTISLEGTDSLNIGGEIEATYTEAETTKEDLGDRVTLTNTGYQENEFYKGSVVSGDNVKLKGGDIAVQGSKIESGSIKAKGSNIDLNGVITTDHISNTARNSKGLWFNENETLDKDQNYYKSELVADNIELNSDNNINIKGASLKGNNSVELEADKDLVASNEFVEDSHSEINRYKNETANLKGGSHTVTTAKQQGYQTVIEGSAVNLKSGGNQLLNGVQISSDDAVKLESAKDLSITASNVTNSNLDEEDFKYWGGIGGGETHVDNTITTKLNKGQISAVNASLEANGDINISANDISVDKGLQARSATGDINIAHDFQTVEESKEDRHGTAFNITDEKTTRERLAQSTVASQLSAAKINLSGENVNITGSDLKVTEDLDINANGELNTNAANATDITETQNYVITNERKIASNLDLWDDFNSVLDQGFEGVLDGSVSGFIDKGIDQLSKLEVEASGSLKGVTSIATKGLGTSRSTSLSANNANLKANEVALHGTNIDAANNVHVEGNIVDTGATEALTAVDSKIIKTTGPEAYIRGGVSGIEIGASIGHHQAISEHNEYQAVNTVIDAVNDVSLTGTESLTNQGTQFNAANVELAGQDIANQASYDRVVDREVVGGGKAALDLYAGTSVLLGGGIALSGDGKGVTTEKNTAHTTGIAATNNANITASNTAVDEGTQMDAQAISIKADDYLGTAAYNSSVTTAHSGKGDVNVSVGTSNFLDIDVEAGGSGEYQYLQTGKSEAIKGSFKGNNISIDADTRAVAAQDVNAVNGYTLTAGEEARIDQDSDKQWITAGGFELGASTGLTIIPAAAATGVPIGAPSFAGKAGFNYLSNEDAQAKVATVNANDINITAGKLAQIDGATLNSDSVTIEGNRANLAAAQDTHRAVGVAMGGNAGFSLDIIEALTSSDDIGVGAKLGVINETSNTAKGATVKVKDLNISANEAGDALVVEGANVTAENIRLTNANEEGNVAVTATESKNYIGNFDIGGNVGGAADVDGYANNAIGAHLNVETDNSDYYTLGSVKATNIDINTGKDINLQSNIDSAVLNTTAGNKLNISSAQDKVAKVNVDTGLAIDGSPIIFAEGATSEDVLNALKDDFKNGTILGVSIAGNAGFDVDHQKVTHQATVNTEALNANIGSGNISVNAAKVSATNSELAGAAVSSSDNDDFVHTVGASIAGETFNIPEFVITIPGLISDAIQGNPIDLGIPVEAELNYEWDDTDGPQTKSDVSF